MKFVPRTRPVNIKVGDLLDNDGRKVEVFYDMVKYSCTYKGGTIIGGTTEELVANFMAVAENKRDWIDVLILQAAYGVSASCPPSLDIRISYTKKHLAHLSDGTWVSAFWAPTAVYRSETRASYPAEMILPYSVTNCGRTEVILPWSESLELQIKQQELLFADLVATFIENMSKA